MATEIGGNIIEKYETFKQKFPGREVSLHLSQEGVCIKIISPRPKVGATVEVLKNEEGFYVYSDSVTSIGFFCKSMEDAIEEIESFIKYPKRFIRIRDFIPNSDWCLTNAPERIEEVLVLTVARELKKFRYPLFTDEVFFNGLVDDIHRARLTDGMKINTDPIDRISESHKLEKEIMSKYPGRAHAGKNIVEFLHEEYRKIFLDEAQRLIDGTINNLLRYRDTGGKYLWEADPL